MTLMSLTSMYCSRWDECSFSVRKVCPFQNCTLVTPPLSESLLSYHPRSVHLWYPERIGQMNKKVVFSFFQLARHVFLYIFRKQRPILDRMMTHGWTKYVFQDFIWLRWDESRNEEISFLALADQACALYIVSVSKMVFWTLQWLPLVLNIGMRDRFPLMGIKIWTFWISTVIVTLPVNSGATGIHISQWRKP